MASTLCPSSDQLRQFYLGILPSNVDAIVLHLDSCLACQEILEKLDAEELPFPSISADTPPQSEFQHELAYRQVEALLLREPRDDVSQETQQQIRVGDYQILEKIGRGGMGAVYKALHVNLGRIVAIKLISRERLHDDSVVARFQREMVAVGSLNHPNVVVGLDAGEVNGEHYLVMEMLDGIPLSELLGQETLSIPDVCEMIRQVCMGLSHVHSRGLIHRDVKPSNLMLCRSNDGVPIIKILDLGLACFHRYSQKSENLTQSGLVIGTLEFMAPEQGTSSDEIAYLVDIYSVGATLYKLISGHSPYDIDHFDTPIKMMHALANETPPSVGKYRTLPEELVILIDRMVSRDPKNRPASLQEVAEVLHPYSCDADLSAILATHSGAKSNAETDISQFTPVSPFPLRNQFDKDHSKVQRDTQGSEPRKRFRMFSLGWIPLVGAVGVIAVLLGVIVFLKSPHGVVLVEINDPEIQVSIDGIKALLIKEGKSEFNITPGPHKLHIQVGNIKFHTSDFEIIRGNTKVLKVYMLKGKKIQITDGGKVIGEHDIPQRKPQLALANRPVQYNDQIHLVTVEDKWLTHGAKSRTLLHKLSVGRLAAEHIKDEERLVARPKIVWIMRRHVKNTPRKGGSIHYGDAVYLETVTRKGPTEWLTGNRGPHNLQSFSVYTADATEEHEYHVKLIWYQWQVRKSPNNVGTGPVKYGTPVYLGCKYYNPNIKFDGYSFLTGGQGAKGSDVRSNLILNKMERNEKSKSYKWKIIPATPAN